MGEPLPPPVVPAGARPGWYPDPWTAGDLRWWDGAAWTANVARPSRSRLPAWLSVPVVVGLVLVIPLVVVGAVIDPVPFLLSLIPAAIVAPVLLWADRIEPEPRTAKLHAFLWGATISIVVAAIGGLWVYASTNETIATVVGAPVIEETMKGLAIVWALKRREIDGIMDGLVYAGWAGLGFAIVEDFGYFVGASADGALAEVVIARALLTPFAHPLFTLWVGLALGRAVVSGRQWYPSVLWGWTIAVVLHACWNGSLVLAARIENGWVIVLSGAVFIAIFVGTCVMAVLVRKQEKQRLLGALQSLVHRYGLPADEVQQFAHWRELRHARRRLDRAGRRQFDRRHALLARLASLHARPNGIDPADEARLRADVSRLFGQR